MNQVFASHVPGASTGLSDGGEGQNLSLTAFSPMPGTIPGTVNPPHAPGTDDTAVAAQPAPTPAPTRVATATSSGTQSEGFFASLARKIGGGATADTTASTTPPPLPPSRPKVADAKPVPKAFKPAEPKQSVATARPALKPSMSDAPAPAASSDPSAPPKEALLAGAQPMVSSNSFESRFSAFK